MAASTTVYLKCERNIEVRGQDVFLKDLGEIHCTDPVTLAKCRSLKAHHFEQGAPRRVVISALELVKRMEETCPGITVNVLGETDILLEWVNVNRHKSAGQWLKAALICLIVFFGTGFTIMGYHNDVGINEIFTEIYRLVMNREPDGVNVIEIAYSAGLAGGIIVFYNHIGGRRITKDPTPLEVAMRKYEKDVDQTVIETAAREAKEQTP